MFVLEPHDTAWDESAAHCQVITSATHRGQKWSVGVESAEEAGGRFIFQREDGPLLMALYRGGDFFVPNEFGLGDHREPFAFRASFADCWNNEKWGRTLFLNEKAQLRERGETARFQVVLSPVGFGSWRVLQEYDPPQWEIDPTRSYAGFFWSKQNARELLLGEAASLGALIKQQWDDLESDLSFALRFKQMDEKERYAQLWSWKRGDLTEMTRVLQCAFLMQGELWPTPDEVRWTVTISPEHESDSKGETYFSTVLLKYIRAPESLQEAACVAREWFAPFSRAQHIARHLCLELWFRAWNLGIIALAASQPTAHERLEAALAWRDWLETTRAG